jgi:hypothetical protein
MEFILTLALIVVSLGGFAASLACALALFVDRVSQQRGHR